MSIIKQIQKRTAELSYVRVLSNGNEIYESEMTSDYCVSVELTSNDTATVQIARDNGSTVKEIKCWLDADGNLDFSKSDWAKWNS